MELCFAAATQGSTRSISSMRDVLENGGHDEWSRVLTSLGDSSLAIDTLSDEFREIFRSSLPPLLL